MLIRKAGLIRKAVGERKDPGEASIYQEHGPYRSIPRRLWSPRRRRDWDRQRKNQIQQQRTWRLFDAACTSVRALADHVHAQVPIPREDAEALAQELRSVRHTLDENALSCFGPSAGEALSALFKLADQAFGAVGPPADNLTSTIDALLRALEAQRRALADWAPERTQVTIPAAGSVLPAAPGAPLFYSFPPADEDGPRNLLVPALPPEGSIVDHKPTSGEAAIFPGLSKKITSRGYFASAVLHLLQRLSSLVPEPCFSANTRCIYTKT